jgi:phage terminase large subunit-like protein
LLAKFARPLPHSFVADDDAAGGQQLLYHAKAERKVGPTRPTRNVMVEGASGILAISPDPERPLYEPSKRRLTGG